MHKSVAWRSHGPARLPNQVLVPVRYHAWTRGDIGETLAKTLEASLAACAPVRVSRLPHAFLVESSEAPGPLVEEVHRAARALELGVEAAYPVLHHEMGPVWTGQLQSVFT